MGTQKMSGLTKRGGIWHIDKVFRGTRIRESSGTGEIVKAQELLAKRIDEIRLVKIYGVRPDRTFRVAATKFLEENQHKRSIDDDAAHLERLDPFIGSLFLRQVHMDSLQPFIASRRADGVKTASRQQRTTGTTGSCLHNCIKNQSALACCRPAARTIRNKR